jgi:hypothetical protein
MHRRLQTNDAFAKIPFGQIISCRQGRMHQKGIMVKIIKDGNEMKAAPFYLVYQGVSAKETDLEWPYNLIKYTLSMMKTSHLVSKKIQGRLGYELFKKNASLVIPLIKLEETWVPN